MVGITQFDFAHVRKCVTNKICYCSGYNLENLSLATNGWSLGFSILRAKIFRFSSFAAKVFGFFSLGIKLSSLISFFNFILVLCSSRVVLLKYIMNLTVLP
ncbi:uncharacterized protein OCT59_011584 [Rhizophagus irregularis]|uniref:uncharacterized protein n=1 Tax=Rhizophagus irregularis TaxID=588596 RepID=UPI003323F8EF|nr:hypothetical protein OCT59_011584 [Rhizophagus irregularis]